MKFNIMFVDDSISVLKSLRWIFMDESYHIFLYDNPLKALSTIEDQKFAVIVSDQMMPEMEGVDFLKQVKQRSPDTEGMIMSVFVKPPAVSNAINPGVVNRFIEKSLDINEIKQAVAIELAQYETNIESRNVRMSLHQPHNVFPLFEKCTIR